MLFPLSLQWVVVRAARTAANRVSAYCRKSSIWRNPEHGLTVLGADW